MMWKIVKPRRENLLRGLYSLRDVRRSEIERMEGKSRQRSIVTFAAQIIHDWRRSAVLVSRWIIFSQARVIVHWSLHAVTIGELGLLLFSACSGCLQLLYGILSIPLIAYRSKGRADVCSLYMCACSNGFQRTYKRPNRIWGSSSVPLLCQYWRGVGGCDCARPICTPLRLLFGHESGELNFGDIIIECYVTKRSVSSAIAPTRTETRILAQRLEQVNSYT